MTDSWLFLNFKPKRTIGGGIIRTNFGNFKTEVIEY